MAKRVEKYKPSWSAKAEWTARANAEYQKVVSSVIAFSIALITVSPFLIKDFLGVVPDKSPIFPYLNIWIYLAWFFLALSLLSGVGFYYVSARWLKKAFGGPVGLSVNTLNRSLDACFLGAVFSFITGFACLILFMICTRPAS